MTRSGLPGWMNEPWIAWQLGGVSVGLVPADLSCTHALKPERIWACAVRAGRGEFGADLGCDHVDAAAGTTVELGEEDHAGEYDPECDAELLSGVQQTGRRTGIVLGDLGQHEIDGRRADQAEAEARNGQRRNHFPRGDRGTIVPRRPTRR
ncbi:hypothetical protein [Nocardia sp. NPDC051981]|uniref:hypothetical protein n=1 Tax=Nocardia sp. NPDC051981 TaxID=3155417 RepID=UPI003412C283